MGLEVKKKMSEFKDVKKCKNIEELSNFIQQYLNERKLEGEVRNRAYWMLVKAWIDSLDLAKAWRDEYWNKKSRPYDGYYEVVDKVLKRDGYTCQVCGFYGVEIFHVTTTICLESSKKGIPYFPKPYSKPPKPCADKNFVACGKCPHFREYSIEYISYRNLVVHHKDGDKCNQDLDNLVTVCLSCHRRLHPRRRRRTPLSIEELKLKLKK